MSVRKFDIAILGAGAAGLTAAQAAAETGVSVIVIEKLSVGGQVATIDEIKNFPGEADPIAGYEVGPQLLDEADEAGAEFILDEVESLNQVDGRWLIKCASEDISAHAVILATGSSRKRLGVVGEEELIGRGVSHCASCDGGFFRDKTVIVAGGGDSALDEATVLAGVVGNVVIVHHGDEPSATQGQQAALRATDNVEFCANSEIAEVVGDDKGVCGVILKHQMTGITTPHVAEGVFVYIGLKPNTEFLGAAFKLDDSGRCIVDDNLQTSCEGVFAAGDLRSGSAAMLVESVQDGKRAAAAASAYSEGKQ